MLSVSLNKTFPSFLPQSWLLQFSVSIHKSSVNQHEWTRLGYIFFFQYLQIWGQQCDTNFLLVPGYDCSLSSHNNCPYQQWKEMFHLTTHSTHFIYSYMVLGICYRTIQTVREETCCHDYMGYSFWLAARILLYAPSHRQDITYHRM